MTRAEAIKLKIDEMLQGVAGYLKSRFLADPELKELRFSSTHKLCSALVESGVSLWTLSDAGVATKLNYSCKNGGPVRGCVNRHNRYNNNEWIFLRQDYL